MAVTTLVTAQTDIATIRALLAVTSQINSVKRDQSNNKKQNKHSCLLA